MSRFAPVLVLALSACGVLGVGADSQAEPDPSDESSGRPDAESEASSDEVSTSAESESESESDEGGFVPTGGEFPTEDECGVFCEIWDPQECDVGEKCVFTGCEASDFDGFAFRCRPVNGDGMVGDPCENTGSEPNSGFDTCSAGLVCYDVNVSTGVGTCLEHCGGTPYEPDCGDDAGCLIYGAGWPVVCIIGCDPLLDDCPAEQGCYGHPHANTFSCQPDLDRDDFGYGIPCDAESQCAGALTCIHSSYVPEASCEEAAACCTPYCDLNAPNDCPGAGQSCLPYPGVGYLPANYQHIGFCGVAP